MSSRKEKTALLAAVLDELQALADENSGFRQAVAERLGLNATDYDAVRVLERAGPLSAGKLAEILRLTTGAITGVLDRLEKADFALRRKDPDDRRQVIVEASPGRVESFQAVLGPSRRAMTELLGTLGDEDLEKLSGLLGQVAGLLRGETARLREGQAPDEGQIGAPLRSVREGRLRLSAGASRLSILGGAPEGQLFRARFEGRQPMVDVSGGDVSLRYPRFSLLDWRKVSATIELSPDVPWSIEIRGGASRFSAELSELRFGGLELSGGASDIELALPRPSGTVELRLTGGASKLVLRRPADVPVQVRITGGVSKLSLDEQRMGAVGGATVLATGNYGAARDRYELRITGGASSVSVSS